MQIHRQSVLRILTIVVIVGFVSAMVWFSYDRAPPEDAAPATLSEKFDNVPPTITSAPPIHIDPDSPDLIDLAVHGLPIDGCEPRVDLQIIGDRNEKVRQEISAAVALLSASDDPEYLIGATFLDAEHDVQTPNPMLERALVQLPEHPVALWHKLQHCVDETCDRAAVLRAAAAADPTNGILWVESASQHIRAGDYAAAERALRRAVSSPRFDSYFVDYVSLIERSLAATTEFDYSQRVIYGIGVAAAVAIPGFADIYRACRGDSSDMAISPALCEELGEGMFSGGSNLMTSMIGLGILKVAATRSGDTALASEYTAKSDELREHYIHRQTRAGAHALLMNDATVLRQYLDDFGAHGERHAIENLVEAAERLRADDTYDQCNFVLPQLPD